ncbi:hypothetical protein [Streptomyces brevispora]|uniref:VCBS repeat protein n=1 Tax=Streptomyces brevispora TaxID=887462 RepID=A0A561UU89_9ACTN|nr:hypothetical protein [Streptomyces brevispora]TWG02928.1 hypothetical protein FHX80_111340 [Streptomyces brevispora]
MDTTGDDRPDVVALATDGARVPPQDDGELLLKAFGHGKQVGGWVADKHPRLLVDTIGDGRLDIVGCYDGGFVAGVCRLRLGTHVGRLSRP